MNNQRCVIFDVGSNNLQIIASEFHSGNIVISFKKSEVTELCKGMINNKILDAGFKNLFSLFDHYIPFCLSYSDNIIITGTACSRNATNSNVITDYLRNNYQIDYCIISSEIEAYFTGMANIEFSAHNSSLCFDVGGGSTEFCMIKDQNVTKYMSIPLGIRNIHNQYNNYYSKIQDSIDYLLNQIPSDYTIFDDLIGVGGTLMNIAAVKHGLKEIQSNVLHKSVMESSEIADYILMFKNKSYQDICQIMPFEPQQPEIIVISLMIILSIMYKFKKKQVIISDKSYSFGLLNDYFTSHLTKEIFTQNLIKKSKQDKCIKTI